VTPPDEQEEALRRRLYRPGASDEDVAAYSRGRSASPEPEPGAPGTEPPTRPSRARRRAGAALVAVAAAALAAAAVLPRPASDGPAPTASASTPAAVETVVRTGTADRNGFVRALTAAGRAGVSGWLDRNARRLPGVLGRATRSDTLEFAGSGSRTLRLDPPSIGQDGGHVTVLVVTAVDARLTWTLVDASPGAGGDAVAGSRSALQRAGALTSASVDWAPGRRPGTLLVVAPDGVRWGVAAVFSA